MEKGRLAPAACGQSRCFGAMSPKWRQRQFSSSQSRRLMERDRLRWLVEKAGELEVNRLRWLKTRFGNGRAHLLPKTQEWAVPALEQSRGAWLTRVDADWVEPGELNDGLLTVVADRGGGSFQPVQPLRVMVGPEGGWAPGEVDAFPTVVGLGRNVLRTETAAIVAAGIFRAADEIPESN